MSKSGNILRMMSLVVRCSLNPERAMAGSATMLIPGVGIGIFGKIALAFKEPTGDLRVAINNLGLNIFTAEGYASKMDVDNANQPIYDGYGAGYVYQSSLMKRHAHNEVHISNSNASEKIHAICITDMEMRNSKIFKEYEYFLKEEHRIKNPKIIFYSEQEGTIHDIDNDRLITFDPEQFFIKESWNLPHIAKKMEKNYRLVSEAQIHENKQAIEEEIFAKKMIRLRQKTLPKTQIKQPFTTEQLHPNNREYSSNYHSE